MVLPLPRLILASVCVQFCILKSLIVILVDIPSEFYDVTPEDMKDLMRAERKRKEGEQHLRTRAMREAEKRKRTAQFVKVVGGSLSCSTTLFEVFIITCV